MIALKQCARCDQPRGPNGYCKAHDAERTRERYRSRIRATGREVRRQHEGYRPRPKAAGELVAAVEVALAAEKDAERLLNGSADADVSRRLRVVAEAKRISAAAIERLASVAK